MLGRLFLQGVVMDHDHLVVIRFRHGKSLTVAVDLMGLKFEKGSVQGDIRHGSQQGLFFRCVVQPNHEEFVMSMGVGEFHTAIHRELEGGLVDLDAGVDLNPFIRLVGAALGEFAEAHNIDAHLIDVHLFDGRAFGRHVHGEGSHDILGDRGLMVKRDDRHKVILLGQLDSVAGGKPRLGHL